MLKTAALLAWIGLVAAQASKALFVSDPSCNSYQCHSTWSQGNTVIVNWLSAPSGTVAIQLNPAPSSSNQTAIPIVSGVPGSTGNGTCANVGQSSCGRVSFIVPSSVPIATFSIQVASSDGSTVGYTDLIDIVAPNATSVNPVPSTFSVQIGGGGLSSAAFSQSSSSTQSSSSAASSGTTSVTSAATSASPTTSSASPSTPATLVAAPSSSPASSGSDRLRLYSLLVCLSTVLAIAL